MSTDDHLGRVRRICMAFPGVTERLSHGAPTFFANKRTFAMFVDNHHGDGHIAIWTAAMPGEQAALMHTSPGKYFRPPYVGVRGWIGIELGEVDDDELGFHLTEAWRMIAPPKKKRQC